ncbi:hypothetical protein BDZ97DRAFT_836915 [Flammula alnicola]|nr:hypothetical protein BDZ97DRAFT_836915 [Flammula alnicola]
MNFCMKLFVMVAILASICNHGFFLDRRLCAPLKFRRRLGLCQLPLQVICIYWNTPPHSSLRLFHLISNCSFDIWKPRLVVGRKKVRPCQ